MNLPCVQNFFSILSPSGCSITLPCFTKSKSPRYKLKNYFTLTKVPEKESKISFRRHKLKDLVSAFYISSNFVW